MTESETMGVNGKATARKGRAESVQARFWKKVAKRGPAECWPWKGASIPESGGKRRARFNDKYAARVSWELNNGPIPEGLRCLHRCDNPMCVNPQHLFLGTQRDNIADMWAKGRENRSVKPPVCAFGDGPRSKRGRHSVKLTIDQAREIKRRLLAGEQGKSIAAAFGIDKTMVSQIKRGGSWKHA